MRMSSESIHQVSESKNVPLQRKFQLHWLTAANKNSPAYQYKSSAYPQKLTSEFPLNGQK